MIVYSRRIIQFVQEINQAVKNILSHEVGLNVGPKRFQDRQRTSYPINIVIYNNMRMLGYFDQNFYELGFHECLMHVSKIQLYNIIRHELAHYMTWINCGATLQPHGTEFKAFCDRMKWGEEVYRASACLEGGQEISLTEESPIFRKIQKLLALATSSNQNEAELAIIKSQQLLLKHNIDSKEIGPADDEKVFLKRVLQQTKKDAKMIAIARILGTFFVSTVFNRGRDFIHLEILGTAINIEIAEYVAAVLQVELDHLWHQAQQLTHLRGTIAKNSFFLGLAKGYCDKIEALKRGYDSHALMVIEHQLNTAKAMAYPHLRSSKSRMNHCEQSSALGEQMGKQLNIHPAINKSSNGLLIT